MSSTNDYIEYVCDQIKGVGVVKSRKMFGDFMIYVNDKPLLLVCDNVVYVKQLDCIREKMANAEKGIPYSGAKEQYILNIDDAQFSEDVIRLMEPVVKIPTSKRVSGK